MENVIVDYRAYSRLMNHVSNESLCMIEPALDFIIQRYENFPCQKHADYAPENVISAKGVTRYLNDILDYEHQQNNPPPSYNPFSLL